VRFFEKVGTTYSIHCPNAYSRLEIEEVETGKILLKDESIFTGKRNSSILHHIENTTSIAFDASKTKLAIKGKDGAVTVPCCEE
jgi:hypothetical protein